MLKKCESKKYSLGLPLKPVQDYTFVLHNIFFLEYSRHLFQLITLTIRSLSSLNCLPERYALTSSKSIDLSF